MGMQVISDSMGVAPAHQIARVVTTIRDYLRDAGGDVEILIA